MSRIESSSTQDILKKLENNQKESNELIAQLKK